MDGIVGGVRSLIENALLKVKINIEQSGVIFNNEQLDTIETALNTASSPFKGLETRYQQDKYLREHLEYLVRSLTFTLLLIHTSL